VATVDAGGAGGDAGPVARSPGAFSVMAVGMLVVGWALWRIPWLPGTALIPPTSSTLHERPVLTLAEGVMWMPERGRCGRRSRLFLL